MSDLFCNITLEPIKITGPQGLPSHLTPNTSMPLHCATIRRSVSMMTKRILLHFDHHQCKTMSFCWRLASSKCMPSTQHMCLQRNYDKIISFPVQVIHWHSWSWSVDHTKTSCCGLASLGIATCKSLIVWALPHVMAF